MTKILNSKLINLFDKFLGTYPFTPNGIAHIAAYNEQQKQGRRNFHSISVAADSGQDITEDVILKLVPHEDSSSNRKKGAWIHTLPGINKGNSEKFIKEWQFNKDPQYSSIVDKIFSFIQQCNNDPNQLYQACYALSKNFYLKHFPSELITPILNALKPNSFLIVDEKSLLVINHFSNTYFSPKLTDYPFANAAAKQLINKVAKKMQQPGVPAMQEGDLFDMFCYWLVAVKKYDFSAPTLSTLNKIPEQPIELIPQTVQPEYTLADCAAKTGISEDLLKRWIRAISRKKQAILQGPPGTGKTYLAKQLAKHLIGGGGDGFMELVQFHPAYCYEDFIQGIRPQANAQVQLDYPVVPGRFLEFCKKAESCEDTCVLIIDEINRANLSSVFGELMYLLEYRDEKIPLAGSNELFGIPENVRIIGTMNTADRSIALVDHALRRRFAFIELRPNYEILRRYHEREAPDFPVDGLIATLQRVNQAINDPDYELGISFFMLPDLAVQIEDIWRMEIEPYLEEYLFDQRDKLEPFRWEAIAQTILP
ncbi:MAG: McrB family protein [Planktothrix sp.]